MSAPRTARPHDLTRRGFLAGASTVAAGSVLAACGNGSSGGSGGSGDKVSGSLRMLTPIYDGPDGATLLKKLIGEFTKKYPDVSITPDYTDYSHLNEKITTSLVGGRPYDVLLLGVGWVPPFAAKNALAPFDETADSLTDTYNKRVLDPCQYKGKLYALPIMMDTRFGIYRKDMFDTAGISGPPGNFDELRDHARRLTKRAGGKLQVAGIDILSIDPRQAFLPVMWANGGDLFDSGFTKPTFNSPEAVEALQLMVDLIHTDKAEDIGYSKPSPTSYPLADGRAAMMIGHNNTWTSIQETKPDLLKGDKLGTFVLNNKRPAIFQGGTLAAVSAKSKSIKAAQAFAKFLAQPDNALLACAARGNVPAAPSTADSTYVKSDPFVQFALSNLDHAYSEGGVPQWLDLRGDFSDGVNTALLGKKSAQATLDDLAAQATKLMS